MLTQNYGLKHQLKISRQQIQLLNFYALNTLEVDNMVRTELEDNPFLETDLKTESLDDDKFGEGNEVDEPERDVWEKSGSNLQQFAEKPIVNQVNFREDAKQQLRALDVEEGKRELAEYIIDSLNDRGMLERDLAELAEDYSFQQKTWIEADEMQQAWEVLHLIEPTGLGARSIRECLQMQLAQRADCPKGRLAIRVIDKYYDDLIAHKFEKICHSLNMDRDELKEILAYIGKLDFYPVSGQAAAEHKNTIIPDFNITNVAGQVHVGLTSSRAEQVTINQNLYEQMKDATKEKSAKVYINNKIQSARWFADALKQREETMLRIMRAIVQFQSEYFMEGDIQKLKPMILKDIAAITGFDLSTISRITASRYAETHFGTIYLKDLFGESLATEDGDGVSNKVLQSMIADMINAEEKGRPYTDQNIADMMKEQGYKIARRTVTKYREMLNIPIAQIRAVQFAIK